MDIRGTFCSAYFKHNSYDKGFDMVAMRSVFQEVKTVDRYLRLMYSDLLAIVRGRYPLCHTVPSHYHNRYMSLYYAYPSVDMHNFRMDTEGRSKNPLVPFPVIRLPGLPRTSQPVIPKQEDDDVPLPEYDSDTCLDDVILYEE